MAAADNAVRSIDNQNVETLYVFNKIDAVTPKELVGLRARHPEGLFVSAKKGTGIDDITQGMAKFFSRRNMKVEVRVPASDGKTIAKIRDILQDVVGTFQGDVCVLNGTVATNQMGRLENVPAAEIRYII
jgi:GTP-binding protein HflX